MSGTAKSARTSIFPAGTLPPEDSLEDGSTIQITITRIMENNELELGYPNRYFKTHQAEDILQLVPKIVNVLKSRYGIESVNTLTAPTISEGAIITMEVFYGS